MGYMKPLRWGILRSVWKADDEDTLFDGNRIITQQAEKLIDIPNPETTTLKGFLEKIFYPVVPPPYVPISFVFTTVSENNVISNFNLTFNKSISVANQYGFISYQVEQTGHEPGLIEPYNIILPITPTNTVLNGNVLSLERNYLITLHPNTKILANAYVHEYISDEEQSDWHESLVQLYATGVGGGGGITGMEFNATGNNITTMIACTSLSEAQMSSAVLTYLGSDLSSGSIPLSLFDYVIEKTDLLIPIPVDGFLQLTLTIVDSLSESHVSTRTYIYGATPINSEAFKITQIINNVTQIVSIYNKDISLVSAISVYFYGENSDYSIDVYDKMEGDTLMIKKNEGVNIPNLTKDMTFVVVTTDTSGYQDVSFQDLTYTPGVTYNERTIFYGYSIQEIDESYFGSIQTNFINQENQDLPENGRMVFEEKPTADSYMWFMHQTSDINTINGVCIGEWSRADQESIGITNDIMYQPQISDGWKFYRSKIKVNTTQDISIIEDITKLVLFGKTATLNTEQTSYGYGIDELDLFTNEYITEGDVYIEHDWAINLSPGSFVYQSIIVPYIDWEDQFIPAYIYVSGMPNASPFNEVFEDNISTQKNGLGFVVYKNRSVSTGVIGIRKYSSELL